MFDGHRLDADLEAPVRLTLDDQKTKVSHNVPAMLKGGEIEVDTSTGAYAVRLGIDVNRANGTGSGWGMPGDLISWESGRLDLLRNGETLRREVKTLQVLRLRRPEDTENGVPWASGNFPRFRSPVTFAWDPVPGARTYGFHVALRSPRGARYIEGTQRPVTTWTVELPPSAPDEYYVFGLDAYGASEAIGIFEVQGDGWRGWDYRFRVVDD